MGRTPRRHQLASIASFATRVEGPAYVPAREEEGGVGALGMLEAVYVDHQRRICVVFFSGPMLAGGEGPIYLPESDDFPYV